DYMEAKALAEEIQRNQFKNQEKFLKQQERFIERFRAKASKAKAVQSRIKALERVERINDVDDPAATINIQFNFNTTPGKVVAELDIKSKKYKDLCIFEDTKAAINRGDKIAFIGANGKGKSTLLRMIEGAEPFVGKNEEGYNVIRAFYAQHQLESLNLDNTLLRELQVCAPDQTDTTLRTLLGAFLFKNDDVFKKIKVLSGGEKSRVALAKTILTKANFMLLDEPTNHLDMQSVNILIQVLQKFKGSYVVVSHDRFFLAEIANKIWFIENQKLKEYPGTYAEYEEWMERRRQNGELNDNNPTKKEKEANPAPTSIETGTVVADNKSKQKEIKKLSDTVKNLEAEMEKFREQKNTLEMELSKPETYSNAEQAKKLNTDLETVTSKLNELQSRWEIAFAELIEAES
ncbi:MAG: ATP-binding cassette domain-containing protein, partial [Bacteroidota bacterium]